MRLQREVVDDAIMYTVAEGLAGDGVFAARDKGWRHVGYDPQLQATFGEIPEQARLVMYNVEDTARTVEVSWRLAEKSEGALTVWYRETVVAAARRAGEMIKVNLSVSPGKSELTLRNDMSGVVIIQDPVMRVAGQASSNENIDSKF